MESIPPAASGIQGGIRRRRNRENGTRSPSHANERVKKEMSALLETIRDRVVKLVSPLAIESARHFRSFYPNAAVLGVVRAIPIAFHSTGAERR